MVTRQYPKPAELLELMQFKKPEDIEDIARFEAPRFL
jgi:hypothetical protein